MAKKPEPATSARQAKIQAASKKTGGGANKIVVAAVVLVVAIIAVVGAVVWQQQSAKDKAAGGGTAVPAGTSMGQGFNAFADVTPKAGAPTLDLYLDFQCPACKGFEDAFGSTLTEQATAGKITLIYHVKNFLDDNLRNDSSTRSAIGAFCAADEGKFQPYFNTLFANHPATEGDGWTDAQLTDFAKQSGINGPALTTWQTCFDARRYESYVNSVEAQSFKDGVKGTPSLRINGEDAPLKNFVNADGSAYDPAKLVAAIEAATK